MLEKIKARQGLILDISDGNVEEAVCPHCGDILEWDKAHAAEDFDVIATADCCGVVFELKSVKAYINVWQDEAMEDLDDELEPADLANLQSGDELDEEGNIISEDEDEDEDDDPFSELDEDEDEYEDYVDPCDDCDSDTCPARKGN